MAKKTKDQLTNDEAKILAELRRNAKENIHTIAEHCGFTTQKARRLIKRIEAKDLIWGYTAIVNDTKLGLNHFIFMAKRTNKKVNEDIINEIVSKKFEETVKESEITIESSFYVHGEYDWIITFTAEDIRQAKKLSDIFVEMHPGFVEKTTIMQTLMFIKKQHILNPEKMKIKELL